MSLTEIAAELLILNTVCMRGIVIFPGVSATFEIGRKASVCAVREAVNEDGLLFLLCQKDASEIEPKAKDLHTVGTVVRVTHFSKLSNGNYQVMVDGLSRGIAERVVLDGGRYVSTVTVYNSDNPQSHEEDERDAIHDVMAAFSSYVKYIAKPVPDVLERIKIMDSADELAEGERLASHIEDAHISRFKAAQACTLSASAFAQYQHRDSQSYHLI